MIIIIVIIMLIEHIAIARKNGRIVIFMEFHHLEEGRNPKVCRPYDECFSVWEQLPAQRKIVDWLDAQAVRRSPCDQFADLSCVVFCREKSDRSARSSGVNYLYCTVEQPMVNAFHDKPGFWEWLAENF